MGRLFSIFFALSFCSLSNAQFSQPADVTPTKPPELAYYEVIYTFDKTKISECINFFKQTIERSQSTLSIKCEIPYATSLQDVPGFYAIEYGWSVGGLIGAYWTREGAELGTSLGNLHLMESEVLEFDWMRKAEYQIQMEPSKATFSIQIADSVNGPLSISDIDILDVVVNQKLADDNYQVTIKYSVKK